MNRSGIVSAGSRYTAQAAFDILAQGGNAVDAVVAAILATPVSEPALSSLAGGGILNYCGAEDSQSTLCEFFANGPGLEGSPQPEVEFFPVDLDFGPTTQQFFMGRGAAAVPGLIPGLMAALDRWGSLPLKEIVEPACRLARQGVVMDRFQAFAAQFHKPMLVHTESMRSIFAPSGQLVRAGQLLRNPALADTLESLALQGWRTFYRNEMIPSMLGDFGEGRGGLVTPADLDHYSAQFLGPLKIEIRGAQVYLNPPPAVGGTLIGLMLHLLKTTSLPASEWGRADHLKALISAMKVVQEARCQPGHPLDDSTLQHWIARFGEIMADAPESSNIVNHADSPGHTTHVSVIDARGNAAGVTVSYGQGNGYTIERLGIPMNNLMGEKDLHPGGFHRWPPGTRLATNMSPTIVRTRRGDVMVMGSGGSNRIRTAILQVISNLVDYGMNPQEAVGASRIHYESGVLNAEVYDRPEGEAILLKVLGANERLVAFDQPNMFFGGVHLACRWADGTLVGAGDPRRSGTVLMG